MNPYETERLLAEYLLFHYGSPEEVMPWRSGPRDAVDYAVRVVSECVDSAGLPENARALDLGCAVGRSSFELTRHCGEVLGVDFSRKFIEAGEKLQRGESIPYLRKEEGGIFTQCVAKLPDGVLKERVRFEEGDAMHLRADIGSFDVVLAANLIDRLTEPRRFLARLPELVRPGGQLILASPYTWLPEFTTQEHWLGGGEQAGKEQTTLEALKIHLNADFALSAVKELPFLIREHARKFQWSMAQATVWRRR